MGDDSDKPDELQRLLTELQTSGARLEVPDTPSGRRGGAGPTDDKAFVLPGANAMVPTMGKFTEDSPYAVQPNGDDGYVITKDGTPVEEVGFPETPRFYELETEDGIPYNKIAVLHSTDVLATTLVQNCVRWNKDSERCRFCGIGISLENEDTIARKTPEQLAEVAEAAVRLDDVKHFVMTTGTTNYEDRGALYAARCARGVKDRVDLPIEAQFEPPEDLSVLEEVRDAGVDSVGIHLECFDPEVREQVIPGKANIPVSYYYRTFERAVEVFGENQVSSYVIVGLGDDPETIIEGCHRLIDMGVYPFVVPFRPILGTEMEDVTPPPSHVMWRINSEVQKALARSPLDRTESKAGCARCGACSGLPAFEEDLQETGTSPL